MKENNKKNSNNTSKTYGCVWYAYTTQRKNQSENSDWCVHKSFSNTCLLPFCVTCSRFFSFIWCFSASFMLHSAIHCCFIFWTQTIVLTSHPNNDGKRNYTLVLEWASQVFLARFVWCICIFCFSSRKFAFSNFRHEIRTLRMHINF